MLKIFLILYLLIGLILSFIYDYYSPNQRTMCQHIKYAVMWPVMFWFGVV